MGLFRPYDQSAKTPAAAVEAEQPHATTTAKNRPTPTRAEAQALRMQTLHPKLTRRETKAMDRREENRRQQQRIEAVESRPERVLMRNFVDSHWSPLELIMPALLILLAASLAASSVPLILTFVTGIMLIGMLVCVAWFVWAWLRYKRELYMRHPDASSRGLMVPMFSRMSAIRRMRVPPPVIKRGEPY